MFKKFVCLMAVAALMVCSIIPTFASDITTNGGSASSAVKLSTTGDGSFDDDPSATAISVTVPTELPIAVSNTGNVTTATTAKITNNSYGPVRVKTATITAAEKWNLVSFGDKTTLANEKVDSNKLGFAMKLGTGTQVKTNGTDKTQTLISAPATGCYMSGVGDATKNSTPIAYDAIVTAVSKAITDTAVASVVFVVEFDTVA